MATRRTPTGSRSTTTPAASTRPKRSRRGSKGISSGMRIRGTCPSARRERPKKIARRKFLTAAREFFRRELESPRPKLEDRWFPWIIAFGLGKSADRWFRAYGAPAANAGAVTSRGSSGGSSSTDSGSSGSWTGGGGSFGGAGTSGSWATAAGAMAAGVAAAGSGGSGGGGGGGGGGSSGGGGGGGWVASSQANATGYSAGER